jgi:quercetin dioxygenase-like cupin family protein
LSAPLVARGSYAARACSGTGAIRSGISRPAAFDLWVVDAVLAPGAELHWGADHGDEAVVVLAGTVDVFGESCSVGAAIVVEAGARATLRSDGPATVVHFGQTAGAGHERARNGRSTGGVHVVGPGPARGTDVAHPEGAMSAGYYLDSTCGTCALTLLRTSGVGVIRGSSHSHSQDELIRVLDGELQFGSLVAGAGMTAAIPANRRYAFRASSPFAFLNYRAGPSSITKGDGVAVRESAASLGWSDLGVRSVRVFASGRGVTDGSA